MESKTLGVTEVRGDYMTQTSMPKTQQSEIGPLLKPQHSEKVYRVIAVKKMWHNHSTTGCPYDHECITYHPSLLAANISMPHLAPR